MAPPPKLTTELRGLLITSPTMRARVAIIAGIRAVLEAREKQMARDTVAPKQVLEPAVREDGAIDLATYRACATTGALGGGDKS